MTDVRDTTAIACTLGAGDFRQRMAWIAELNRLALRSHRRNDLKLELIYASAALDHVRDMIAREKQCCAFLSFTVRHEHDSVRLVIEAPESSRDMIDSVFEPFLAREPASLGCGCSSTGRC